MPVIEHLFLRHATDHNHKAPLAIETDQAGGKTMRHPLSKVEFVKRGQYGTPPDQSLASITDTNSHGHTGS